MSSQIKSYRIFETLRVEWRNHALSYYKNEEIKEVRTTDWESNLRPSCLQPNAVSNSSIKIEMG